VELKHSFGDGKFLVFESVNLVLGRPERSGTHALCATQHHPPNVAPGWNITNTGRHVGSGLPCFGGSAGGLLVSAVREAVGVRAGFDDVPAESEPVNDGRAESRVGEGFRPAY
jgi:hypothetical protein